MNPGHEFAWRIRLATLATKMSAEALNQSDGIKFVTAIQDQLSNYVTFAKILQDTARTGHIPPAFAKEYEFHRAVRYGDADKALAHSGGRIAIPLINAASALARWVIRFKSIPKGQAKLLERAVKPFVSVRQAPRKVVSWLLKNEKNFEYLVNAFKKWPDKGDDSPDKYKIGPFSVHNTLQLAGEDLEKTNKVIEAGAKFIKSSGIPNAAKMLYGDVFVVGKLKGHNTLAWYNVGDDNIYLRPLLKADLDATHSLTHEIGHRYYRRVLSREARMLWERYHSNQQSEFGETDDQVEKIMKTIRPGEPLPFPVKGWERGGPPIVVGFENLQNPQRAAVVFEMTRGAKQGKQGKLSLMGIASFLSTIENRKMRYPTAYAATSPEEHFADSFAMYSMKKLTGIHKENFEKLIVNR